MLSLLEISVLSNDVTTVGFSVNTLSFKTASWFKMTMHSGNSSLFYCCEFSERNCISGQIL